MDAFFGWWILGRDNLDFKSSLFSWYFLLFKQSKKAFHIFLTAFILAVIFVFFKDITMAKSGRMAKIISLQSGYYLWLLSIFVAACYSFYQNFSLSKLFKR